MKIGVVGCGTIASAVVRGIAEDGHQITVSERSTVHSKALSEAYANVRVADNQSVLDASDVVFLGLMAEVAPDILGNLRFRDNQRIITFMAGATLQQADAMVQPARAVAIMMPFPNIAQGGSPVMVQGDTELVAAIFGDRNKIFPLKDADEMAAYLCAQAVLSPVTQMISHAAHWMGKHVADQAQGEAFLRALVSSNLSETGCDELINALNTPGGYNQRLRLHIEAAGMEDFIKEGLNELM